MVLKRSCGSKDGASHSGWARPCHNTGRATLSEGVLAREKGREKARHAHLSSGVPNLQLYALAVQRDGADFEIDPAKDGAQEHCVSAARQKLQDGGVCAPTHIICTHTHPIVVMKLGVNELSAKRIRMALLPTPESPISRSFTSRSYVPPLELLLLAMVRTHRGPSADARPRA
jgi:hypothetical protein